MNTIDLFNGSETSDFDKKKLHEELFGSNSSSPSFASLITKDITTFGTQKSENEYSTGVISNIESAVSNVSNKILGLEDKDSDLKLDENSDFLTRDNEIDSSDLFSSSGTSPEITLDLFSSNPSPTQEESSDVKSSDFDTYDTYSKQDSDSGTISESSISSKDSFGFEKKPYTLQSPKLLPPPPPVSEDNDLTLDLFDLTSISKPKTKKPKKSKSSNSSSSSSLKIKKSRKTSKKSRKASKKSRKSKKTSRKSKKASRKSSKKSRKASKKSRKVSKKSRKVSKKSRKSKKTSRKSKKTSRKSKKTSRKSSKKSRKAKKTSRKSKKASKKASRKASKKSRKSSKKSKKSRKISKEFHDVFDKKAKKSKPKRKF